ncbi:hypothetical protein BSK58_25820 [Paenibacillus odorifer]|nr:hypothetical protein BSK58_25820 [Paenibacillus odorifer]
MKNVSEVWEIGDSGNKRSMRNRGWRKRTTFLDSQIEETSDVWGSMMEQKKMRCPSSHFRLLGHPSSPQCAYSAVWWTDQSPVKAIS